MPNIERLPYIAAAITAFGNFVRKKQKHIHPTIIELIKFIDLLKFVASKNSIEKHNNIKINDHELYDNVIGVKSY
jgi:hypothetical protein